MAIVLPTKKQQVLDYNPRLLVIYSKPKMGKSTFCAALDDNLIIDLDKGGYRALEAMVVSASSYTELREIAISLDAKKKELGKVPYRFITLDNSTHLEEYCLYYALLLYRQTHQGKEFGAPPGGLREIRRASRQRRDALGPRDMREWSW